MNCRIDTTPDFARELKLLAKRYPSMRDDYRNFLDALRKSPLQGEPLGRPCARYASPLHQKQRGKAAVQGSSPTPCS